MINLEIKNLSKKIKTKEILQNINLSFEENKVYGLIGNNGVGKTTLLKCIFNEFNFEEGQILFKGNLIKQNDYKKMYFFPENNDLPKNTNIFDYLERTALFYNLKLEKKLLVEIKDKLKIKNLNNTKISELSSGQQKVISIICCEMIDPDIIFFDEPTANLDIENKEIIFEKLKYLKFKHKTIVLITHLIEEIKDYLDEVIILHDKVIKAQFLVQNKNIRQEFLKIINYKGNQNYE